MRITGQSAVSSVQDLSFKLMEIEKEKNKKWFGLNSANAKAQTLTLIKTFPIPNTVDDILEFILLANVNIDVNLSRRGFRGRIPSGEESEVSNAWVSKMQQAYQKAEIAFPNDPSFKQIQKIYFEKMKELRIEL